MDYSGNKNAGIDFNMQFDRKAADIHTSIPAIIQSVDYANQVVAAIPAIQIKIVDPNTKLVRYINRPIITNIPMALSWSEGLGLGTTMPYKAGDKCTLFFAERALDNFLITGEISPPADGPTPETCTIRCFDETDAMCFPGIITKVKIPNYSSDAVEIRNADKSSLFSLSNTGLTLKQGEVSIVLSGGKIKITGDVEHTGNEKIIGEIQHTGNQTTSGTITGQTDVIGGTISVKTHTHQYNPGPGSPTPTQPPE